MESLYQFINSLSPISENSFSLLAKEFKFKKIPKKTILCGYNDTPENLYFIKSGLIRAYTIDRKGKEYTKSLFRANQFSGALSALIKKEPSKIIYQTVTDCEVLIANYHTIKEFSKTNNEIARVGITMLEMFYLSIENKLFEFTTKDATERYLSLLKGFEGIEKLMPQYQIATVLGITPIQLSRIRKKLHAS